jgi:hypothetical protein
MKAASENRMPYINAHMRSFLYVVCEITERLIISHTHPPGGGGWASRPLPMASGVAQGASTWARSTLRAIADEIDRKGDIVVGGMRLAHYSISYAVAPDISPPRAFLARWHSLCYDSRKDAIKSNIHFVNLT